MGFGSRVLWRDLDLTIEPGEFVAVLGPNGAGKSTMISVILGQQRLRSGSVRVLGKPVREGSSRIGFIPQQRGFESAAGMRGRDLVALGLDGHRWGISLRRRSFTNRIDRALQQVGAIEYADVPLSQLSGGEQQRLRVAQAIVSDPGVLLCDEPLLSLDLHHQDVVTDLISQQAAAGAAVLFVTHEINPVLPHADRVVYLVDGEVRIGAPDEVLTSAVLSELYGAPIDVLRHRDKIVVLGGEEAVQCHPHDAGEESKQPYQPAGQESGR